MSASLKDHVHQPPEPITTFASCLQGVLGLYKAAESLRLKDKDLSDMHMRQAHALFGQCGMILNDELTPPISPK